MTLQLTQIREWLGLSGGGAGGQCDGYSIDSRTVRPGDLFFAIRGPSHDGHDFVADALQSGAVAAVVDKDFQSAAPNTALQVADPAAALRDLGAKARRAWGGTVIGVTGSSGKTTTKEATAALLAECLPVAKSEGNLNNQYGLPLSLLRIPDDARAAVVEVGINHAGEMRPLAELAAPDVSVVTNVGAAHIGNFDSVDQIASEKRGLVEALAEDGTAVLNADDPRVSGFRQAHPGPAVTFGIDRPADVRAEGIEDLGAAGVRFRVAGHRMESALLGIHNVRNVLAAIAAAGVLGYGPELLGDAVRRLRPTAMRGLVRTVGGVTVIDDCYNANPAAMAAMLEVLGRTAAGRRIAVLGEMRELGANSRALHREVGGAVDRNGIDYLVAVGGDASEIAEGAGVAAEFHQEPQEAACSLAGLVKPGDAVLIKASRGVALESVRDALVETLTAAGSAQQQAEV